MRAESWTPDVTGRESIPPWVTWGLVMAVALLLVNDHLLKATFPGVITGKLSDFAGLFAFPLFLAVWLPRHRRELYWAVGLGFVWWKSPLSETWLAAWNSLGWWHIGRTPDFTDLVALLVLPFSYRYGCVAQGLTRRRLVAVMVSAISVVAFGATSYIARSEQDLVYRARGSRSDVLESISALGDELDFYDVRRLTSTEDVLRMHDEHGIDRSEWAVLVVYYGQGCRGYATALVSLDERPVGVLIRLHELSMVNPYCPDYEDENEGMFADFERAVVDELEWELDPRVP